MLWMQRCPSSYLNQKVCIDAKTSQCVTHYTDALPYSFPVDGFRVIQAQTHDIFGLLAKTIDDTNGSGGDEGDESSLVKSVRLYFLTVRLD